MKFFSFLILFYISHSLFSQNFSGILTYKTSIIPKDSSVNIDEILKDEHGEISKYYIMNKYYKSVYFKNGEYNYSYTYDDETKRMYDDYVNKQYVTFRDSRSANIKVLNRTKHLDSTIKVQGHKCYLVKTTSNKGLRKYYYSNSLRVNPDFFKGHKVGNWYEKLNFVNGSLMLKSITEYDNYIKIREVIKIEEKILNASEFKFPKKPVAASFSALDTHPKLKPLSKKQHSCLQKIVKNVSKPHGETVTIYTQFLLTKDLKTKFIHPYNKDESTLLNHAAIDVIKSCKLTFSPAYLDAKPIDSEVYLPIEFKQ